MFIEQYYLKDLSICDSLIKIFKTSNKIVDGKIGKGIDKKVKDSNDLPLNINDINNSETLQNYFKELSSFLELYKKKYHYCNDIVGMFGLEYFFNIQKYKPSQAYHGWHCEKANIYTANRHLVFMTYLNNVKEGGETEWFYQKLKVKPQKGLTVIWPSEWTFTHKGYTTINEDKYIITGWYEFKK